MAGPDRPKFVLFGSSIVQFGFGNEGWAALLSDIYARKADIVLRGYSGWNTRRALEVLDKVFPKNAAVQPELVIIYFGGNDSMKAHPTGQGPRLPLDEYVENMKKIANHLMSLSDKTRLIFLTSPPVNEAQICKTFGGPRDKQSRTNELCGKYSDACVELCQELGLKVIDLWTALQQRDDWLDICFTDGIHLSAEASKIAVKEILKVLKEAEWEPSLHWRSLPNEFSEDSPYYPVGLDGKPMNLSESGFHWRTNWD